GEPSSAALPPGQMILSVGHVGGGLWWLTFGRATVAGWWLALYLALVLLYYFALEVTTGQTAGKRLAGLRVVRADGGRPSASAVAGRTLLRLIDWLPLLYLVGFISVLATGQRRERLGDLAAGTRVMRARPAPRGLPAAALAVAALAVLGLSVRVTSGGSTRSCQAPVAAAGGTLTYRAHCVSFDYPAG